MCNCTYHSTGRAGCQATLVYPAVSERIPRGNFWLAWTGDRPAGYVGTRDKGDHIELRRMYVRQEYHRRGIGAGLVRALIAHCAQQRATLINLWAAPDGLGRLLYAKPGFYQVALQIALNDAERYHPSAVDGKIRMSYNIWGRSTT
ncbi:MAG: GNAT family N-acetyltransferase [Chloroflexi bacterium]|nr:GNAT family N-acetyltransferase [Chloroflexota bacterium]